MAQMSTSLADRCSPGRGWLSGSVLTYSHGRSRISVWGGFNAVSCGSQALSHTLSARTVESCGSLWIISGER